MVAELIIAGRTLGPGTPCFVIAEAGVNHDGDPALAEKLIDAAAAAGADAVKFQTFNAERQTVPDAPKAEYQKASGDAGETQQQMLKRLELPDSAWEGLRDRCTAAGLIFLSSPFDEQSADFLAALGVDALKIPSGELTNLPFLRHVAALDRPLIVSTGMADLDEVAAAVEAIGAGGDPPLALLHCVSAYPAPAEECNLRTLATLGERFGVPVGWSDHTLGSEVSLAAVALGACIVEKHFTLDRTLPGPDHAASIEPSELKAMIAAIRKVESALGSGEKRATAIEQETAAVARKSLVAARAIAAGALLTGEDVTARRPGTGIPPSQREAYLGRRLNTAVAAGTLLAPEMFE